MRKKTAMRSARRFFWIATEQVFLEFSVELLDLARKSFFFQHVECCLLVKRFRIDGTGGSLAGHVDGYIGHTG